MANEKQPTSALTEIRDADTADNPPEQVSSGGISGMALLVAGAFFMEYIDGTVIATALPQMGVTFGVSAVDLNIGMSAYLLTLAVLIPASGWIADRFGSRQVFTVALAIFTLSSVLCGLTQNVPQFVLMRILQGAGGALMVPVGRLAVLRSTPKPQLIKAIATLTWPALVAPILGPPLGGFITDYSSWRWIFFINLPLGIVAIFAAWKLIPNPPRTVRPPFDLIGFVTSGIAMLSLVYGLELTGRQDAPWPYMLLYLLVGLLALFLTLRHLQRAENPMIRLNSIKVLTFRVTLGGGSLFRMAIGAVPFLLPIMFQVGFGMDAFHAGSLVLAVFAGNLAMKPATTPLIRHFGFRKVLLVNGTLGALSLLACAFLTPTTPSWVILSVLFYGGLCRSMQFTGISTLAFADIPQSDMSYANTLFSTAVQLSIGMGITIGAIGVRIGEKAAPLLGMGDLPGISYRLAFVLITLMSLIGLVDLLRLPANAGESVSRKPQPVKRKPASGR
ncbi:MFS transporter [Sodalis ligni]|jgi:EmrB/QacA subfamily drug resistance transporter|uniref:EmrB/QacA subfamily drug resistance transporter n=2 Tax=Sodalis ligni TaxID=2697027 RepID=A0A4R1NC89_9GAMM|nr:MFS transporter [Sodalis ligni]TCL04369.1 EmrB/QacA subfamily drug resistance transporter [Sodalis ligni]